MEWRNKKLEGLKKISKEKGKGLEEKAMKEHTTKSKSLCDLVLSPTDFDL